MWLCNQLESLIGRTAGILFHTSIFQLLILDISWNRRKLSEEDSNIEVYVDTIEVLYNPVAIFLI